MIKAVLADLDGTLYEAVSIHSMAFNHALQTVCGFKLSESEHWATFNGLPTKRKTAILLEQGRIQPYHLDDINESKQLHTIKLINQVKKTDGEKVEMLQFLKRLGIKVACVTNSISLTANLMLSNSGQLPYLDLVISNEDVKLPKPSPEGYLTGQKYFGLAPEECVVIEDSPVGKLAGYQSGSQVLEVKNAAEVNYQLINRYLSKRANLFKRYPIY